MVDIRKKVGMPRRCGYFRSPFCYGVTVKIVEKLAIGMMGKKFPKPRVPSYAEGIHFVRENKIFVWITRAVEGFKVLSFRTIEWFRG